MPPQRARAGTSAGSSLPAPAIQPASTHFPDEPSLENIYKVLKLFFKFSVPRLKLLDDIDREVNAQGTVLNQIDEELKQTVAKLNVVLAKLNLGAPTAGLAGLGRGGLEGLGAGTDTLVAVGGKRQRKDAAVAEARSLEGAFPFVGQDVPSKEQAQAIANALRAYETHIMHATFPTLVRYILLHAKLPSHVVIVEQIFKLWCVVPGKKTSKNGVVLPQYGTDHDWVAAGDAGRLHFITELLKYDVTTKLKRAEKMSNHVRKWFSEIFLSKSLNSQIKIEVWQLWMPKLGHALHNAFTPSESFDASNPKHAQLVEMLKETAKLTEAKRRPLTITASMLIEPTTADALEPLLDILTAGCQALYGIDSSSSATTPRLFFAEPTLEEKMSIDGDDDEDDLDGGSEDDCTLEDHNLVKLYLWLRRTFVDVDGLDTFDEPDVEIDPVNIMAAATFFTIHALTMAEKPKDKDPLSGIEPYFEPFPKWDQWSKQLHAIAIFLTKRHLCTASIALITGMQRS